VAADFGLIAQDGAYRRATYVFDTRLRVLAVLPFDGDARAHSGQVLGLLKQVPAHQRAAPAGMQAPVLVVPRIFEPGFCRELIATYERQGGGDSGFMRLVGGQTVGKIDHSFKRRRDCEIEDERQRRACRVRLLERLIPEIAKAFQFQATKVERYIVSCYDAAEGGFFRAHRDNQTPATRHRRFAVSLFLNTGDYEGGFLQFAEYGRHLYSAPAGGAVVFSCSLLHEATPVTRGRRYMFLPFLF
jgi:predicted 2-oxoglutarate/Fe(II)-dependent dioxygenase YbiX